MGWPERLVDRRIARYKGLPENAVFIERLSLWLRFGTAFIGLAIAAMVVAFGDFGERPTFWITIGAVWLVSGYISLRQHRHLRRIAKQRRVGG